MSFLEDLVGSFAQAGKDVTSDITRDNQREREMQIQNAQRERELQIQNDLAMQRAEAAEKLRIRLEDERAAAKQKRISDQSAEIEAAAPAATAARQLGEAQSRAPSVDSNVLDIIKSKLTPAQLKQYYGVDTGAVAGLNDRLGIARQKGYFDAEAELKATRAETVAELKAELDRQFKERSTAATEARADAATRSADAAYLRAEKYQPGAGSGGADSKERLALKRAQERRVDLNQQIASVMKENELGLLSPDVAKTELTRLKALRKDYEKVEADAEAAVAKSEVTPAPKPGAPAATPTKRPPLASFNK